MYGIVTALQSEADAIINFMGNMYVEEINNVRYMLGTVRGKQVALVIAGIGKINAAAMTSRLIVDFKPKAIFLSGIAGRVNARLKVGDIVIGEKLYSVESLKIGNRHLTRDLINIVNGKPNVEELKADQQLISAAKKAQSSYNPKYRIIHGLIATTDIFPPLTGQIVELQKIGVDAIEMEGFAVMHVCWLFRIPCLIVRSISDYATESLEPNYNDVQYRIKDEYKMLAANNACKFITNLLDYLPI